MCAYGCAPGSRRRDDNARVRRDCTRLVHQQRIDVELADPWQLADQRGDAQQNVLECVHIGRRHAAERAEQLR